MTLSFNMPPLTGDTGAPTWLLPVAIAAAAVIIVCIVIPFIKKKS